MSNPNSDPSKLSLAGMEPASNDASSADAPGASSAAAGAGGKDPRFAGVIGSSSAAVGAGGAARTHTVQAGDSLSKIAKQAYGDGSRWNAIFEANKDQIDNPDKIFPGQVLRIP